MSAAPATAELRFHWQDRFTPSEQAQLKSWIVTTDAALTELVGELPFTRHIFFHRRENAREPVPWAHTQRGSKQGVHFHVDPRYSLEEFLADWTAPHELSHLVIPYLGRSRAWFAEGFASYMQYQVMGKMGIMQADEIEARYDSRFEREEGRYDLLHMPFAEAAPKLRSRGQYPTMYWGGAVYFVQVDRWLKDNADTNLLDTLRRYVDCCRMQTRGLDELIAALDQVVQANVFHECLTTFETRPGFPEFRDSMISAPSES